MAPALTKKQRLQVLKQQRESLAQAAEQHSRELEAVRRREDDNERSQVELKGEIDADKTTLMLKIQQSRRAEEDARLAHEARAKELEDARQAHEARVRALERDEAELAGLDLEEEVGTSQDGNQSDGAADPPGSADVKTGARSETQDVSSTDTPTQGPTPPLATRATTNARLADLQKKKASIVLDADGNFVDTACHVCGANMSKDNKRYTLRGLRNHLRTRHAEAYATLDPTDTALMSTPRKTVLTERDINDILNDRLPGNPDLHDRIDATPVNGHDTESSNAATMPVTRLSDGLRDMSVEPDTSQLNQHLSFDPFRNQTNRYYNQISGTSAQPASASQTFNQTPPRASIGVKRTMSGTEDEDDEDAPPTKLGRSARRYGGPSRASKA